MVPRDPETAAPLASLADLVSAVFNGAPTPEAAAVYSAQLTALISLYICFVAVFLIGVYVRAVKGRRDMRDAPRTFKIWIAYSLMFAVLVVAANVAWFYFSA